MEEGQIKERGQMVTLEWEEGHIWLVERGSHIEGWKSVTYHKEDRKRVTCIGWVDNNVFIENHTNIINMVYNTERQYNYNSAYIIYNQK